MIETKNKTLLKYDIRFIEKYPSQNEFATAANLFSMLEITMDGQPVLPVSISYVGSKYLLFDIDVVTWLRREHHICGVMGGTLPQSPSQNIFLGLPVQIMPEEAQFLVEKGVANIVDDEKAHIQALHNADHTRNAAYLSQLRQKGQQVSLAREQEKAEAKRQSLKKVKPKLKPKLDGQGPRDLEQITSRLSGGASHESSESEPTLTPASSGADDTSLFDSTSTLKPSTDTLTTKDIPPHNIVPTSSALFLPPNSIAPSQSSSMALLPNVPTSYPLYKHLNSKAYFVTPGLRFGCQYCVYPGDPLRFHSHFLAVGREWDEEIDLMDLVGGGRLGTGVKKGFLIGGREPPREAADATDGGQAGLEGRVRTFSIEWAAM